MYVDGCIRESVRTVRIHGVGAGVRHACGACLAVEDGGVARGDGSRSIESEHPDHGIRERILSRHRMAWGGGSRVDKGIVACQGGVTASTLGVNRRNAVLPTGGDMENRGALRILVGPMPGQPCERGQGAAPRYTACGQPCR